jgi:hypothetical protein
MTIFDHIFDDQLHLVPWLDELDFLFVFAKMFEKERGSVMSETLLVNLSLSKVKKFSCFQ